ncbi:unnamed protein product [Clavelina lepadiformis]|uniref:Uncharacterized protein n=1 Tax=Clavelina lepadiformis TaxID=159417 RepID=A0ABP0GHJ1_CLALP
MLSKVMTIHRLDFNCVHGRDDGTQLPPNGFKNRHKPDLTAPTPELTRSVAMRANNRPDSTASKAELT